jgi:hypothetical protein
VGIIGVTEQKTAWVVGIVLLLFFFGSLRVSFPALVLGVGLESRLTNITFFGE